MQRVKKDLRQELENHRYAFGLLQKVACSAEENKAYMQLVNGGQPLPQGVYRTVTDGMEYDTFYTIYDPELTEQETEQYLRFKKLKYIRTIKNCVLFFTITAIISMVIAVLSALSAMM